MKYSIIFAAAMLASGAATATVLPPIGGDSASANANAYASGGNAISSNTNANTNVNTNTNANTNVQGQEQGQMQGQVQGQAAIAIGMGGAGGGGGAGGAGGHGGAGGNASSSNEGNTITSTTTVTGDTVTYEAQKRDPVATAYAAPLVASIGTCLGSASGGVQATGVGIAFGTTTLDEGCDTRYDAAALKMMGASELVVKARLCAKPEIRAAYKDAGQPCPQDQAQAKQAAAAKPAVVQAEGQRQTPWGTTY